MIEGQIGYVVASYLAAGAGIAALVAWVGLGHRVRLRQLRRFEEQLTKLGKNSG